MSYAYAVTLVWVCTLSFYHHQIIYDPAFRSIQPALIVLVPITYIGAMLVIPGFSVMMLLCLIANYILDGKIVGLLMGVLIVAFFVVFIAAVFFTVHRTVGLIAKIEFNNLFYKII